MFITFEGIEGSGKTTQLQTLGEYLRARGVDCLTTREPGGTALGGRIRAILLDPASAGLDPKAELLLYMADRAQHLAAVVRPALEAGRVVLCDRYFDATVAYQAAARGLGVELVAALHVLAFGGFAPDATLLFDLPPEIGLARAWRQLESGARTGRESRFEEEKLAFHTAVREGYLQLARKEPGRFYVIDAARPEEVVRDRVLSILKPLLET